MTVIRDFKDQLFANLTGSINRKSFAWIILLIALIYIPYGFSLAKRFDQFGIYINSSNYTKALEYLAKTMNVNTVGLNLQSSYEEWGKALNGCDAGEYIRGGMGIADGKGISIKCLECKPATYTPYTFRPPATSMAIALIATIFGKEHVYPYFIFTLILQFLCSVMIILSATRFVKSNWGLFSVGLLSIFCPPITNLHYGLGLFMAEPLSSLFLAIAFYFLGKFWDIAKDNQITTKSIIYSVLFAISMALASYSRDIYGAFLVFICLVIGVYFLIKSKYYFKISKVAIHFLIKQQYFKTTVVFISISLLCLSLIQYPLKHRNKHIIGHRIMATSSGGVIWRDGLWMDHKKADEWCGGCGLGFGHYLNPEIAQRVQEKFVTGQPHATLYSIESFVTLVWRHPIKAFMFKATRYDSLWFGARPKSLFSDLFNTTLPYLWCVMGSILFLVFLSITRFRFFPELWSFPLFVLMLSPLIHFEHRYSHPFFLLIVPITSVYVIEYIISKYKAKV
jgi:hypothetical protein